MGAIPNRCKKWSRGEGSGGGKGGGGGTQESRDGLLQYAQAHQRS